MSINDLTEALQEREGLFIVRAAVADVAELADAQVLGACGEIRVGSSPSVRTSHLVGNKEINCASWECVLGMKP